MVIPEPLVAAVKMGRLTALVKDNGKVRGVVAGDVFRRSVARTSSRTYNGEFESACSPFQYALSTKAGTECVARNLRTVTEIDASKTIISIDGVSAFDHIWGESMLTALGNLPQALALLPFVQMFYGDASEYLWSDDSGETHTIKQREGGEQGDPPMPALYALGQHMALVQIHSNLQHGAHVFACLDDIYVACDPGRVSEIFGISKSALKLHANVEVNLGKTRL